MTGKEAKPQQPPLDPDSDPTSLNWAAPKAEVRGHRAYRMEASAGLLTMSRVADLSLAFLAFTLLLVATRLAPDPRLWWLGGIALTFLVQNALCIALLGRTPGEFFWQLSRNKRPGGLNSVLHWASWLSWLPGKSDKLLQCDQISSQTMFWGTVGTLGSLLIASSVSVRALFSYPIWQKAESAEMLSYFPVDETEKGWNPIPFFYTLGTWPVQYQGTPVLYRLPYEKGPPTRFVGHLVARWNSPSVEIQIEGPKTPLEAYSREEIRNCLISSSPLFCLGLREKILSRHTDELSLPRNSRRPDPSAGWKLNWFTIKNPALSPEEQLQGFSIRASHGSFERRRYVLITPKGIHQSFTLTAPTGTEGDAARDLFEKSLRSLRASDELSSGTAWIDRRLESTHLGDLNTLTDPREIIHRYAEIQSLLLAKITVDPKTYDTYYHLAGVSLTLAKYLEQLQRTPQNLADADTRSLPLTELLSSANSLIDSAYRYALDINPTEPRNAKIKNYLDQAAQIHQ